MIGSSACAQEKECLGNMYNFAISEMKYADGDEEVRNRAHSEKGVPGL